jgi:hypothetical protein
MPRVIAVTFAVLAFATVIAAGAGSASASGFSATDVRACLELTNHRGLDTKAVTADLGLTVDQIRETRYLLSGYWSVSGFAGFDGLGLTPGQIATMKKRIAAQVAKMNAHPVGWPCAPFTHKTKVAAWMRAKLVDSGYSANVRFYYVSPRQIQFRAWKDGQWVGGAIAKTGVRTIAVELIAPGYGSSYSFGLPFVA